MIRNLLYHIYPVTYNGVWQRNVKFLLRRLSLFNGKKVVAIVCDHKTDDPAWVRSFFKGHEVEFIVMPNDPALREVQTFESLFSQVESLDEDQVTFFGHAKAVTNQDPYLAIWNWVCMLHELCLDYWPLVEKALTDYPLTGPFLCTEVDKDFWGWWNTEGNWLYYGSFWWFRNKDIFEQPDWRRIDRVLYGIEPYNAIHFPLEKAHCLFHPGRADDMTLYERKYFEGEIVPAFLRFREQNKHLKKEW